MTKIYVWSIPTRLFHLFLITLIILTFITSEEDNLLSYHVAIGYTIGLLFIFRIMWGLLKVKYSNFKDFNFSILELKEYLFNVFGKKKNYIGHNPASSFAIVAMIMLAILSVVTGIFTYGIQEGKGILSFLNIPLFKEMELFEELHEFLANAFLMVIIIHIIGVLIDKFIHKSSSFDSMIDGYKYGDRESLKLSLFQKIFGFLWILLSTLFLIYMLNSPKNILMADSNIEKNYKIEHSYFESECISCHTLYPPFLLPKKSWIILMDDLENHFGDDASLDDDTKISIRDYLVKNSAENSTKESAFKFLKSIKDRDIIAMSESSYWKKRHKNIDKEVFKRDNIKNLSNCKACHKKIENGLLNDEDIEIPI